MVRVLLHVIGWWMVLGSATLAWLTFWEKNADGWWATAGRLIRLWLQWMFGGA